MQGGRARDTQIDRDEHIEKQVKQKTYAYLRASGQLVAGSYVCGALDRVSHLDWHDGYVPADS